MEFTCTYCDKPINSMGVIVDKTHIFHKECEKEYNNNRIKWFEELRKKEINELKFVHKFS